MRFHPLFFTLLCLMTAFVGCGESQPSGDTAETTPRADADTDTASGTDEMDRLVLVLQKQKDPDALREDADRIGDALTERLDVPVEVMIPGNYSASVQALVSGQADVAYVSSLPFLLARGRGRATDPGGASDRRPGTSSHRLRLADRGPQGQRARDDR